MSYLTRLAAERTRRENQRRRRPYLATLAAIVGALAVLQLIVLIAAGVPALGRALPDVVTERYGQGGTLKGDPQGDEAASRSACQAPLWRRAISKPPTRALVTVLMGTQPLYTMTIDCRTFTVAVEGVTP